jgi:putative ABC transport system permease protein
MNTGWIPVRTAALADLRRRKLQTWVIAFVILLASGAATLALSILVETDAPFDHAFAHANGAHLVIAYDAHKVSAAQLRATATAPGVTAAAGPWLQVQAAIGTGSGGFQGTIAGRPGPDTAVDRLTMESGRWARSPGEIVLSQSSVDSLGVSVGDRVTVGQRSNAPDYTVVGIAASISPYTQAWVLPGEIAKLHASGSSLEYQMLYRVQPNGTATDLSRAAERIARYLPPSSVVDSSNYLDVKRNADLTSSVMVPFLLAFSGFALLAAVFIIANIVSGVVIAGYRDHEVHRIHAGPGHGCLARADPDPGGGRLPGGNTHRHPGEPALPAGHGPCPGPACAVHRRAAGRPARAGWDRRRRRAGRAYPRLAGRAHECDDRHHHGVRSLLDR